MVQRNAKNRALRALFLAGVAGAVLALSGPVAFAAGEGPELKHVEWSFEGAFGTFDRDALRRGYQVYEEVCSACHAMKYLSFRNLMDKGGPEFDEALVKELASNYDIIDGPDDEGEMFERARMLQDPFPSPFANDKAAAAANNGAVPPDLSLIIKARAQGPDYVYSLLTSYREPPEGLEPGDGQNYNPYFPGGMISMAPPLYDGGVDYEDGSEATIERQARDVVSFLMWAAEPKLEARHKMGFMAMIYMAIFTLLLFVSYKKIWRRIGH